MKTKFKAKKLITLAAALLITSNAFAADTNDAAFENAKKVFQEKCEFLNEDELWVIICVLNMVTNWQTPDMDSDVAMPKEKLAKISFYDGNNWNSRDQWNSLLADDKLYLYYYLSAGLSHISYYEWACETKKFSKIQDYATAFTRSIVNEKTTMLFQAERNEELERMGYGLDRGICEYEQFYSAKKSYLRSREKVAALLKQ